MGVRHKFNAIPVLDKVGRFASKLEWSYFNHLKLLQKSGEVLFFLRQVPFHFEGGKYICDYQIFNSDGSVRFVDVKGIETSEFKLKKRIVESLYPIKIEIVKRENF